ncbi:MAG: serine/threonine protein kinase [Deltaproteobacteria bacterium]|nr:serine/threonine protein kinase [Deltaproteobacteria bacterium]
MGERVGPYEVTELLAAGGMAEIFLGHKDGPGGFEKQLVIKRIAKKLLGDREIEHMFVDEARVQALLDHPNIVQIYDFGEDRGSYYLAMELVRGATLRWVIDNAAAVRRPIPMQHALRIAADVLCGLHYAHERADDNGAALKLIHRDISPVNVLISRAGIAKLCDFGVAKSEIQRVMTRAGIVKGKFRYMSPEQLNAEPLDRRADLFAVGTVLWEMLSGKRLFDQANEDEVVAAIRKGDYPAPSELRPGIPRPIDRILRKALHTNRERRFKSAREFQLACEEILRMLPSASNSVLVGEYVSAELDGTAGLGVPTRRRQYTPENDSMLASGFEVLDPPVPSSPTTISNPPPPEYGDEGSDRVAPPPGVVGRLAGALLVAPAAVFGGIGKAIEGVGSLFAPRKHDPEVRLTRTQMRD